MEVDGMYENTPWERMVLVAPYVGAGALLVALVLYFILRRRDDDDALGARVIAEWLGATGASLATLGVLFTIGWRAAHDTYPYPFGRAALWTGGVALILAGIVTVVRVIPWRVAFLYGIATAATCAAIAIAAFSHSIIAEGQVTAMVVPVSFVFAAVLAVTLAAVRYRDTEYATVILGIAFTALSIFAAWKLPIVQFRDNGASTEYYPNIGSLYAVLAGVLAGLARAIGPAWWLVPGVVVAGAVGYIMQMWFGVAIAVLGVGLAIGLTEAVRIRN